MKALSDFNLSSAAGRAQLQAFRQLLDAKPELSEGHDILPFFEASDHLSALVGMLNPNVHRIDRLGHEFDLFGDFRCDLVVGDFRTPAYTLVEFEDARRDSVFRQGAKYTHEWAPRFEHGYSQLVDWFWKIADLERTGDFAHRFGGPDVSFSGMLVIGRRSFVTGRERQRFRWRSSRVVVNSNVVRCLTFDDLYDELDALLTTFKGVETGDDKPGPAQPAPGA